MYPEFQAVEGLILRWYNLTMRKHYSPEFKAKLVQAMLTEQKTANQLAAEHGVHPTQLYAWRATALAGLPSLFSDQQAQEQAAKDATQERLVQELYAEIGKLTTPLNWRSKKLPSLASKEQRMVVVEPNHAELKLTVQARLLGINRTQLYYQRHKPKPQTISISERITQLYAEHPDGVRRITAKLNGEGTLVNHKEVARLMREMGLQGVRPGPNLSKRKHKAGIYPYLLRGVKAEAPNDIWGIDITYIRIAAGWMYLVAVLDWYSRYVVSWELDQSLAQPLVTLTVARALETATPKICNSDQGSHFTSTQYLELLIAAGVPVSMDGRGRALDNVYTERLWWSIKHEEVYLREYQSPREAREYIGRYLHYYNEERPHQALGWRTPANVYHGGQATSQTEHQGQATRKE